MALPVLSLNLGQTKTPRAIPEDANSNPALLDTTIPTWTSSDPTVVSVGAVAADGLSAPVTGVKPGSATITVAGQNSNHTGIQSQFQADVAEVPAVQFGFVLP